MMSDPQSTFSNHHIHQLQHVKTPHALHELQQNPSIVPNSQMYQMQRAISEEQRQRMQNLADIAQQADPPQHYQPPPPSDPPSEMKVGNDMNTVYGNDGNVVTTDYGLDDMYTAPAANQNGRRGTKGGPPPNVQSASKPDELEGGVSGGSFYETEGAEGTGTGSNIPPQNPGIPRAGSNNSDDDVLGQDFVTEVQPDPKATPNGVNLYFLDPDDPHHQDKDAMYGRGRGGTKGAQ